MPPSLPAKNKRSFESKRVLNPSKTNKLAGANPFLKTKTSGRLRKFPRTPQAALTWRSAMFRAPFPGWGRLTGGTCALIASAFSSPPAHAAENDGRPPNPRLAGASSTTRTMVCACRSRPLAVILHACCRLRRRCPASGGRGAPRRRGQAGLSRQPDRGQRDRCMSTALFFWPAAALACHSL
jgi:hypothetical protein